MLIVKLGGTSIKSGAHIKSAAESIAGMKNNNGIVVVVSAMAGVSDALVKAAESGFKSKRMIDEFIRELKDKHSKACETALTQSKSSVLGVINSQLKLLKDALVGIHTTGLETHEKYWVIAFGEKLSAPILSGAIADITPSTCHYGDDGLIITDNYFRNAKPLMQPTEVAARERLLPELEKGIIPVVTGFMGCTIDNRSTTLGRGSSDYIASILGSVLDAEEIQIWTDVDGMLTANPHIVKNPELIREISYNEAAEIAYFGAKVLHPKTISPAVLKNIPIRIINSAKPDSPGTLIVRSVERPIGNPTAITAKKDIVLIDLHSTVMLDAHGFLSGIFDVFKQFSVSVDMVSTTEVSVSLTIDRLHEDRLEPVVEELGKIARVKFVKEKALVCVIGEGMKSAPGLIGCIFACLGENKINVNCISMGASETNLSFVIENDDADNAIRLLHDRFFGEKS